MTTSPYHAGERQVQRHLGEEQVADRHAPAIRPTIPASVAELLRQQPLAIASSLDAGGRVWTSAVQGTPGFARCSVPTQLALDLALLVQAPEDVLWANLARQPAVSLLFIDFPTKWRFRVNGRARAAAPGWVVDIDQAFLNCPKYLPEYPAAMPGAGGRSGAPRTAGPGAPPDLAAWLRRADSFFVGSSDGALALDTAYRGGPAGFVQLEAAGTLLVPDYAGNSMYNSLGNFALCDAAGLLFLDPATGRALQLTGRAEVLWSEGLGPATPTGGPGRQWRFTPGAWVEAPLPVLLPFG
ncbi:pyridoxamine 5'-phosphate oxidase family protein [Hymenobacter glaciei]|uniref:Pyridoxamine 5'-phosphate oxidase family protein n=1 Tax=Hymenobacter glaciei TaxID=877209 RepID=A0ABP7TLN5_9BACT